ncbi:MAG: L,D-transpeptidase family protein [Armatimonadota bacterium]
MKLDSGRYQTWLRAAFVIIVSGLLYLGLQFTDLFVLRSFADSGNGRSGLESPRSTPVAYVPVGEKPALQLYAGGAAPPEIRVSEIGDGGDLGNRARRMLAQYQPYVLGQERDDIAYVSLATALDYLGGELKWSPGAEKANVLLPDALISFIPGQTAAERNFRPFELAAPAVEQYGQLRVPVKSLEALCGVKVVGSSEGNLFTLTRPDGGNRALHVIVRERMYNLEISRSGRWLQVFFLGQPIKRYPLCTGRGNNTPVGRFHIQNKAVWPPWTAYWGEYMPGGSARNPLGARWLGTTARGNDEGRAIGIHGTNEPSSIGQRISGGCLRTYNENAVELYNNIPVGTQVYIHE